MSHVISSTGVHEADVGAHHAVAGDVQAAAGGGVRVDGARRAVQLLAVGGGQAFAF